MSFIVKNYNILDYNFVEIVSEMLEVQNLNLAHEEKKDLVPNEKLNFYNETKTEFHKLFYEKLKKCDKIKEKYELFIKKEVCPYFDDSFVYQTFPSFRIQLPNEKSIHYWHYDSDEDHRHPEWEINFQITLTNMEENNSVWIESIPGLKDFKPMILKYGEYSIFDGNRCTHGNKLNDTNKTRISFDFRVVPYKKYLENLNNNKIKKSATAEKEFLIGNYYSLFKKE